MRAMVSLIAVCLVSSQLLSVINEASPSPEPTSKTSSRDAAKVNDPRPLTVADLVSMREIGEAEVKISPSGEHVAFVVKRASLESNNYETGVFVIETAKGSSVRQLFGNTSPSGNEPHRIDWSPEGQVVSFLSTKGGSSQIWLVNAHGGEPKELTHHPGGIHNYRWSPDGGEIAFTAAGLASEAEIQQIAAQGIVYDGSVRLSELRPETMIPAPEQLWIYDVKTQSERKLWGDTTVDVKAAWFGFYGDIYWSPDGTTIAVLQRPAGEASWDRYDLVLVSARTGSVKRLIDDVFVGDISWSPDSKQIAFVSSMDSMQKRDWDRYNVAIFTTNIAKTQIVQRTPMVNWPEQLWWSKDGNGIYFERRFNGHSALYELQLSERRGEIRELSRSKNYLSAFSPDAAQRYAACVTESVSIPPEVAVFDLQDGSVNALTNLHPDFQTIRLGEVTKLTWTNKYGDENFGYLVKPLNYVRGKRFPLVVVLYHFPGTFLKNFLGNYPIQVLAANGYAVVCMNVRNGNHPDKLRWYSPLDTLEKVTQELVTQGIADPQRKGLMGWSYGGEIVNVTVTHSDIFQAVSVGEGAGAADADSYFLQDEPFQKAFLDKFLGGWPDGEAAKNWREVSPALNAPNVHAPVMIEAQAVEPPYEALHYYTALKKRNKAVELVIYPKEPHVFYQPKHLFYSMERNLDWFNFWLKGQEDPAPAKTEQYARWRELRKLQQQNDNNSLVGTTMKIKQGGE